MAEDLVEDKIDILIVDDRPENLISLEAILKTDQYNIIKASSGREALRYLLGRSCAIILMDVQMPEMDGFETAALIKQNERSAEIPIIFVTAINTDEIFVHRGYKTGAVDYIFKPLDADILRAKVAVFAELYRSRQKIQEQAMILRENDRKERQRAFDLLELRGLKREQILQKKYRDLVEGIQNGIIWLFDPTLSHFSFVSSSSESLLGYTVERWQGDKDFLHQQLPPNDYPRFTSAMQYALKSGEGVEIEHQMLTNDNRCKWFRTTIRTVENPETNDRLLHGLSMDITKTKTIEIELERALQVRDEFLSIASHELKTPLTSLKLQLQILKRTVDTQNTTAIPLEKLTRMLNTSLGQMDRLAKLVEELLDVSKIRAGKLSFDLEEVNLNKLLDDVLARFADEIARSQCTVEIQDGNEPLVGLWNAGRIEQVIINLLSNAIKYAPKSKITFGLSRHHDVGQLTIQDEGPGIPPEQHLKIFERFERLDQAHNIGGLGLGLYIVKQIVLAHDGDVFVESEPGQGCKFIVQLPLKSHALPKIESPTLLHSQMAN